MPEEKDSEDFQRRWESLYRETPLQSLPWEEGGPASELVELVESGRVEKGAALDICCGSGNNAIYLAGKGFICYGIDISPTAISYALEKAAREGVSCAFTTGNAIDLPYADNTFTLVFDRGCFHTVAPESRDTFVRGVHRVLKPGGKYQLICFSTRDHPSQQVPYSFSPRGIRRYFSPLFRIHHIREIARDGKKYFLSALMEKEA